MEGSTLDEADEKEALSRLLETFGESLVQDEEEIVHLAEEHEEEEEEDEYEEEEEEEEEIDVTTKEEEISASQGAFSRIALRTHKAGLEKVDKDRANKIIYELSKNSKYFQNEQKKGERVEREVQRLQEKLKSLAREDTAPLLRSIDAKVAQLEAARDLTRTFFHVDMDAFYAAVEIRDNPSLKGKPIAVGSNSMLSTASYEARQYGVRSAMPGFIAKQLCPSLTIVPLNFDKYRTASSQTREVFATFDRDYRAYSLDEASLDVTDYLKTHPDVTAAEVAARLRSLVFQKTQLTCSVGIAPTRKIAKICSDLRKPNGQYELEANRQAIVDFMKELPVGKVSGIGKVTERLLKSLDITQCGQLYEKRALLVRLFKPSTAEFFLRTSLGLPSNSEQKPKRQRKSISKERTFRDSSSEVFLLDKCRELSKKLASSLAKKGLAAKNVTIKLKTHDFQVLTRSSTMTSYISSEEDIYNAASKLLRKEMPITLRLFGVRLSSFPSSLAAAADDSSAGNNAQKTIDRFFCNSSSSHNKRRTDILLSSNEAKDVEGKRQIGLAGQNVEENAAVTSPLLPSESPKRQRTDATIASTPVIIPRRIPLTTPSTSASSASSTPTKVMTLTSNRTAVSPSKKSSTTSKRRRSSWSCGVKDQQQPTITSFFVRPQ